MNAEIVAIGDELTSGQRLDTNSQWLSQRLGELGIRVLFHTTVADDLDANVHVFRQAIRRADVVVSTGGLGPTADDLTREALARATGQPLQLNEAALAHIRALFARRKREMPPRNVGQAMLPATSRLVDNPHGTAPGIDLAVEREGQSPCRFFALPGVPAEMHEMWERSVGPALSDLLGDGQRVIRHRCLKCFGVGESELEQMLPDLIRRGRVPAVGITANKATLTLRITAEGATAEDCRTLMEPTVTTIYATLGNLVFGEGDEEELQHAVVRLLRQRRESVASIEVGSAGLLAHWLGQADESRSVYAGGCVVRAVGTSSPGPPAAPPDRPGRWDLLLGRRVLTSILQPEFVAESALAVRELWAAEYGLAIGGFPASDDANTAPGDVYIGLATPTEVRTGKFPFAGHPDVVGPRTVKLALNLLRLRLLES